MEWVGDRASVADRDGRSHPATHKRDEQLSVREPGGVTLGEAPKLVGVLRARETDRDFLAVVCGCVVHNYPSFACRRLD
jgi:hypothetical protein